MKKIAVESIAGEVIVAREIRGASGNILLNKGATVNAAMGKRLKNWGIVSIYIEGEEDTVLGVDTHRISFEELNVHLGKKFEHVIHNPVMKEIFSAALNHRVQREEHQ